MSITKKRVCILGSGNWGTVVALLIGNNVSKLPYMDTKVHMYVHEELIDGKKLSEIINETHENIKYLPGHPLPPNVIAITDVHEAVESADIIVFVLPHLFIRGLCESMVGHIKTNAVGISLIKGFDNESQEGLALISHIINEALNIEMSVLMGANLAKEIAMGMFSETTIGCKDPQMGAIYRDLIQTDYFRATVVEYVDAVEVCGAIKNVVALGAGFADGMGLGDNTKAAIIRIGMKEMMDFIDTFYHGSNQSIMFESCGIADLITTCYGGRNRRVAEAFIKTKKTIKDLEAELLNGQKLEGPVTAEQVYRKIKSHKLESRFPLMTSIHKICIGECPHSDLIDKARFHHIFLERQKCVEKCECDRCATRPKVYT